MVALARIRIIVAALIPRLYAERLCWSFFGLMGLGIQALTSREVKDSGLGFRVYRI